jgi:hypothetical protein
MGELTQLAKRAKSQRDDHAIVQDELLELLRTLASTQKQIDAQMNSDIAKSTDISDTEWDRPAIICSSCQSARWPTHHE